MKHHLNVRVVVLLALCLSMIVLSTSCGLKTWLEEDAPWVKKDAQTAETSETVDNDETDKPTTTTKPKDETPVPDVEHKDEMSDDDFIHGSWGDTSER